MLQDELSLRRTLHNAGVVVMTTDEERSTTSIVSGRVTISLGKEYKRGSPEEKLTCLRHEAGHVARGDLLVRNVVPILWNIASDAKINEALDATLVKQLDGVLYERLRKRYSTEARVWPERTPLGASPIYDLLKETAPNVVAKEVGGCGGVEPAKGAEGVAAAADAVLRLRGAGLGGDSIRSASKNQRLTRLQKVPIDAVERALAYIYRYVRRVSSKGALTRVRSYARPGRIKGLRGVVRRRRCRIVALVDVSGSMTHLVERIAGGLEALAMNHDIVWVAWATAAALVSRPSEVRSADVGSGTVVQQAFSFAGQQRPDVVLVVTDGEFADVPKPLDGIETVWVLSPHGSVPAFGRSFVME